MNGNGKLIKSDVNDPLQQSGDTITCRKRSILQRHAVLFPSTPLQVDTNECCPQQLGVSLKIFEDAKKNCKEIKLPGQSDMPVASLCNMCCRKNEVCVNLQHNHTTVLTVSDLTRLPSWDIRQILASVCSRCLVYISAITESSSKLRTRCEQAMHSQNIVLAPPTPDTSPNNFLQTSKTLLDDTPNHMNNEQQQQQQRNCYTPGYCDDTPLDALENPKFQIISRSPSPSNACQNSMLEIHYERPVSPLNTESGGGGKNRKRNYQRIQVIPVQMICTHCNRAYWRKDYYRKHMRRCTAKYRYAKSVTSQRSRSRSRLEPDEISVVSEGNDQIVTYNRLRKYHCNVCQHTADSFANLKQHKLIHLPRYICDICNKEYNSQNEYDFHRVECEAKKEVLELALLEGKNENNFTPARRKTRSVSRAVSLAAGLTTSNNLSTKKVKSPVVSKKNVRKAATSNDDIQSCITNYAKRRKATSDNKLNDNGDFNKAKNAKYENGQDVDDDDDEHKDEDDDDDDVSVIDTLYSKRMSLTNHWVEEHSLSSQSYLSQSDNYINNFVEDIAFSSLKEYDLYLLERLKNEVKLHFITCFVPDCKFACSTLSEMMVHDYIYHLKMPWFNCHKCGHYFTSKVFLDYHLHLQNKGRYVCHKCGNNFEYQHQLDRHLIQHSRMVNGGGEKYICKFCNLKFLDEDKLLKHCNCERHNWNEKRHMIQIDHSMTISNKVQQKRKKNKKYQVKIFNMVLKLLPTKRCVPMEKYRFHLPPHLRIPKRIGQVNFPYPSNPNCVGCL